MRDLIILGTGIHSLEMAEIAERINRATPAWRLVGYLSPRDDRTSDEYRNGHPVLGGAEQIAQYPDAWFVPDNEWPRDCPLPWERMASLVDPTAFVSRSARLGRGCVIYPHCFVGANAILEDRVFVLAGCVINHDDVLGRSTVLASGVTVAGAVQVGRDCYLGQRSTIRQQLCVGDGSTIGMGAVVIRDVPPGAVMIGNPARVLRMNDSSVEDR